jgi:uncharacterized GH25 family protein
VSARRAGLAAVLLLGLFVARGVAGEARPVRLQVLGPDGRPLMGARVVAPAGRLGPRAIFDPGATVLGRSGPGGRVSPLPRAAAPWLVWAPGCAPVRVPPGPAPATVLLLAARATNGAVRLPGPRPPGGREVLAVPRGRSADVAHLARLDAQGRYAFPLLQAGAWDVYLRHAGGRLQRIGRVEAGHSLAATSLGEVSALRGQLLDSDGAHETPVPGVRLLLHRLDPGPVDAGPAGATTGPDGTFEVRGLEEGPYEISLQDEDWAFDPRPPKVQVQGGVQVDLEPWFAVRRRAVRGRVVDDDGHGVRGAQLRLLPDPTAPLPPGARPGGPEATTSDPQGRYVFRRVAPGEGWRLVASAAGFSPWVSDPFRVARGEDTELEPCTLRAGWRAAVTVRTEDGDALAGARLVATAAHRPSAAGDPLWQQTVRRARSGAGGEALLTDLPQDDVLVDVTAPGFRTAHVRVALPRVSDRREVEVALARAAILEGRLVVPLDGPTGPFRVVAVRDDGGARVEAGADAQGHFRLVGLGETAYDLHVLRAQGTDVLARLDNVVPGTTDALEIPLPVLHAVRGTVDELTPDVPVRIVVETQRFDPARERTVWQAVAGTRTRVETDPDGTRVRFAVEGLAPGPYAVRAVQGALGSGTADVRVAEDDVEDVELTLSAGARVAGSVLDAADRPVLGALVRLRRMHGASEAALPAIECHSDDRGDFLVEGLAPGVWRVEASDADSAPAVEVVRLAEGEVRVVRDLRLGGGGVLAGLVQDADGEPLDGVHVVASPFGDEGEGDVPLRTDAEGRFRLVHARPGVWRVRVAAATVAGGPWIEALVNVVAGEQADVRFTAGEDGAIRGRLLCRGKPVAGALVELLEEPRSTRAALRRLRSSTAQDGTFEFTHLEEGDYTLQVQSGAWRSTQALELRRGDDLRLDLEAHEGRLRGRVFTTDGDPVGGARVEAVPAGGEGREAAAAGYRAEGRTDPSGSFTLQGLPVGRYTLLASARGLPPGRIEGAEAELPGADFPVEIVLGRGGDVLLHLTDDGGRGVTGALVWIEDGRGTALNREAYVTGAAGRLHVQGVPPGDLRLRVVARGFGRPAPRPIRVEEGHATEVELSLRPGGALRLRITGEGGDPVGRTRVDLLRAGSRDLVAGRRPLSPVRLPEPWGMVPGTGVVTIGDLEEGSYVVVIDAGRTYRRLEVPVHVDAGRTLEVPVVLAPAGR